MIARREPEACEVRWCDEVGEHSRHISFIGSLIATDFDGRVMTVQVIAESMLPAKPAGAVVLVDSRLHQTSAELTWPQAQRVGHWLLDGARRYG